MDSYLSLFSEMELFLFNFCPLAGAVGGLAHMLLLDFDWTKTPKIEFTDKLKKDEIKLRVSNLSSRLRGGWYLARIILGSIAGLMIFLFVHGSITDTAAAASKILILSFFSGFSAPSLFKELEDKYKRVILNRAEGND